MFQFFSNCLCPGYRNSNGTGSTVQFVALQNFFVKCSSTDTLFLCVNWLSNLKIIQFISILFHFVLAGLHMSFCNESFFLNNTQLIIDILVEEKKQHPEKQIILRSTLPQHFDVSDESGYYDGKQEKQHCANVTTFLNHWTNYYVDEICRKYGFKYMDPAPIYMDRFDLHFEEYTSLDCTHFCSTPEIYIPEVVMLNELLE